MEARINQVVESGNAGYTYKLKDGAGQLNRHLDKYSDKSIRDMKRICRRGLMWWGYTANPADPQNDTAYFDDFEDKLLPFELE